jgi:predicted transcriptional regulator
MPSIKEGARMILFVVKYSEVHHKLMAETLKMVKENEEASLERQQMIKRGVKRAVRAVLSLSAFVIYFTMFPGFSIFCWTHHFIYDTHFLPYTFKFPLDITTEFGYSVNAIYQLIAGLSAYVKFAFAEILLVIFVTQASTSADLFALKLGEIDAKMINMDKTEANYRENVKKLMKEIIEEHRKYKNYLKLFLSFAQPQIFCITSINVLTCATCLITVMTSDYYAAYGFLVLFMNQQFFACWIGEIIRHKNEKILARLREFQWYSLPLSEQKAFLMLVQQFQNPRSAKILFIGNVGMELFTMV